MAVPSDLTILWRGSLESCNYGCPYCPFAKTKDSRAELAADRAALERFEAWAISRPYPVSVLITPWGEGLIRKYYREAMTRLSHAPNIPTIAIQTNLSCSVAWVEACDLSSIAFWTTFHPGETDRAGFLAKIRKLDDMGARYSVGVVGLKEHFAEIEALRSELPDSAYLWVNAYKREPDYYGADERAFLEHIDPLFSLNERAFDTRGRACAAGSKMISVKADGEARRCHFLPAPIGNIYDSKFEDVLTPRPCSAEVCRCHIGYSHLGDLNLQGLFGEGFLERRATRPSTDIAARHLAEFDEN